jgi:VanZ family protein
MKIQYKYALLVTWMIVIFLFSSQVAHTSSAQSAVFVGVLEALHVSLPEQVLTFLTRKAAHTFIYFVLGILMFNVIRSYDISARRAIWMSIVFVCGYACTDEFHQIFVSGRSPEVTDVLIDTCGGASGVTAYYIALKMRIRFARSSTQSTVE